MLNYRKEYLVVYVCFKGFFFVVVFTVYLLASNVPMFMSIFISLGVLEVQR